MKVLEERGRIYGDFKDIAEVSQKIKNLYYINKTDDNINEPVIDEGFEMIVHKLSRIINGGWFYIDNWKDLVGYAQLIADYLENHEKAIDSDVFYKEKDSNNEWRYMK